MIKVAHITKSFGATKALQDLSFTISSPGVVGLLGPNGAGKTTTMRMLTGYLTPDSGTIEIAGIPLDDLHLPEVQRHLGYLPENNPLYKGMLVGEFLDFTADMKGIPVKERKGALDMVVRATALADVFYRPIYQLSKGYRQRVGMAASLLGNPRVLIMDEPTEGLDPNQRVEIRNLIKELGKHHTVLLSTHVLQEALFVCTRMLIIHKGTLVADGSPEELSSSSRGERIIEVELEGEGVEEALHTLLGVQVTLREPKDGHCAASLTCPQTEEIRPALSGLIQEHRFIVWKIAEERITLEDMFHRFTLE